MKSDQLEGRAVEISRGEIGKNVPNLIDKCDRGEGVILSEGDVRLLSVRNFGNRGVLLGDHWFTSTLSMEKEGDVKVILPYETESRKLTDSGRYGLNLIGSSLSYHLNTSGEDEAGTYNCWDKFVGEGVYTLHEEGLNLWDALTEEEAKEHELLLTKLGHPNFVDRKFARPVEEVEEIIEETFRWGERLSNPSPDTLMKQSLYNRPNIRLEAWNVCCMGFFSRSALNYLSVHDFGKVAFEKAVYSKSD